MMKMKAMKATNDDETHARAHLSSLFFAHSTGLASSPFTLLIKMYQWIYMARHILLIRYV
jgi:hypothetical protein